MFDQVVDLSKQLISIPSTKDNIDQLGKIINFSLNYVGKNFYWKKYTSNRIHSLLFSNKKTDRFKIILNAHLDVVPGKDYQYKPYIKNGRLYGRGAYDMKGPAAVEILVFKELVKQLNYPIALQLVTDEEIGGFNGTKYQISQGIKADFIIAGESTDLGIKNKAKGIIWAKIKTKGVTGHGAYLWQGKNAIWKMNNILNRINNKFPEPKKNTIKTTVNIAFIETTNQTFNKIPEDCLIGIDVRYSPEEEKTILQEVKKILPNNTELEILLKEPPQYTPEHNKYIQLLRKVGKSITNKSIPFVVKHGASDIRHFNTVGCDGVEFGPVGSGIHTDEEWVDLKSLGNYYDILKKFFQEATAI